MTVCVSPGHIVTLSCAAVEPMCLTFLCHNIVHCLSVMTVN